MAKEYPLSLIIRAVDKATAPLRAVNERIQNLTKPVRKLNNSFKALSAEAGIPRLVKSVQGVGGAVKKVGSEALGLGLKIAAIATGASFAFYGIVRGAVEAGDNLATFAQRVGMGVDAYAQLQYAAAQADVEQEQFNASMDQFNRRLGELRAGVGPLKALGATFQSQLAGAKSTEEALGLVTRAFEKVTDPGKRAALAAAVFGKSGLQMGQFLGQGAEAIQKQRDRYLELAGSQEEFASNAGELDNALRDTETAFLGLRNAAAGALFPALTELAGAIENILVGNRESLRDWAKETGKELTAWVKGGGLDRLVTNLKEIASAAGSVAQAIGGLKGVLVVAGAVMSSGLLVSIGGLVKALLGFGAAALPVVTRGVMLLIPWLAKLSGVVVPALGAAWAAVAPVLATVGSAIASAAATVAPFVAAAAGVAAAGYAIWKNWDSLVELFTDFTGPGGLLQTLYEMLKDLMHPLDFVGNWFKTAGQWWGKELGIAGGAERPLLGATPPAAGAGSQAQAHVAVDFINLPRGAKVTTDPKSTADMDVTRGYSMVTP